MSNKFLFDKKIDRSSNFSTFLNRFGLGFKIDMKSIFYWPTKFQTCDESLCFAGQRCRLNAEFGELSQNFGLILRKFHHSFKLTISNSELL